MTRSPEHPGTIPDSNDQLSTPESAALAAKLFAIASSEYPASPTAQSVKIARLCQEQGVSDPLLLFSHLSVNTRWLDKLVTSANSAHQHTGNGPRDREGTRVPIGRSTLLQVAEIEFTRAQSFLRLPSDVLEELLGYYPAVIAQMHATQTRQAEISYYFRAQEVLIDHPSQQSSFLAGAGL